MFDPEFQKRLQEAGTEILNKIGVDSQMKYMKNGGNIGSKISIRTGRLVRSILGQGGEQIRDVIVNESGAIFSIGSKVPYAALHELGGVRNVTQAMRRFFRYMAWKTKEPKWIAMMRSSRLVFYQRPYLKPAIADNIQFIKQVLEKKVGEYLKFTITRIITGQQKAGNLQTG